jgi:predicted DNA-binding protein
MLTKLTIKLPEELRRRAKAVAALRGETVSDVIREALQNYIAEAMEEADDVRVIRDIESKIAYGQESVSDWKGKAGPETYEGLEKD